MTPYSEIPVIPLDNVVIINRIEAQKCKKTGQEISLGILVTTELPPSSDEDREIKLKLTSGLGVNIILFNILYILNIINILDMLML